jgi:hypothetical protein
VRKIAIGTAGLAAVALVMGSAVAFAPIASASAFHPDPSGHTIGVGPSPTGVGNCAFANDDASFLVVRGNVVLHDSTNKNGDWGGMTFEGDAIFQEAPYSGFDDNGNPIDTGAPVGLYEGRLTYWAGGGNNVTGQSEGGFTLTFHGTAVDGAGTIDIHVTAHQTLVHGTVASSGTPTANVGNVKVSCS